jgi:hypothetical protein
MKKRKNPLSFWNLLFPPKSSNITFENRKLLIGNHIYGFIAFCLGCYIIGMMVYMLLCC